MPIQEPALDLARFPAPVPLAAIQGTLALDLQPSLDPPEVSCPGGMPGTDVVDVPLPVRRDLERWSRTFAQAAVEIVGGDRPVSQLLRWATPHVHADLHRRAQLVARAGQHEPGLGRRGRPANRPQVVSVHPSFVTDRVAEVSIRVRTGARCRALAARFEIVAGRWQCTALEFA